EEVEKQKEIYLDILVPQPLTIYKNNTLRQKIMVSNAGNMTLRGITLSAETNQTMAEIFFSTYYFPELKPGEERETEMVLTAYKIFNHYEIIIWANVSDPNYRDKLLVYVNSVEKSKGNQSVTATKVTFANDLLSSNPECMELNEFLKKAIIYMDQGEYDAASDVAESVIQGCKYLVSQGKLKSDKPTGLFIGIDLDSNPLIKPALVLAMLLIIGVVIFTVKLKNQNKAGED
ncbi:MAG: hypothetical protein HGA85_07470, partial [Nanoarchaeota archaeon]|nr:hypothetical protein [Nanoarchaeota archaeon]